MKQEYLPQGQGNIGKEDKVLILESHFSTVTQGGKAHQRIKKLHQVIAEANLGEGLVKIEYKRGV